MSPSIFDADCPDCGATLTVWSAWQWRCNECGALFERCGRFLLRIERSPADLATPRHAPFGSDGRQIRRIPERATRRVTVRQHIGGSAAQTTDVIPSLLGDDPVVDG